MFAPEPCDPGFMRDSSGTCIADTSPLQTAYGQPEENDNV